MSNQLRKRYDIIINGGGIVGFTALNLILKSPYLKRCKVLLIEQSAKPNNLKQPSRIVEGPNSSEWNQTNLDQSSEKRFSNRVSSITKASRSGLEDLGIWDNIKQYSKDVRGIKVWNYDYSHRIVFDQSRAKQDTVDSKKKQDVMFSVIENNRLSLAILNNVHKCGGDSIIWEHSLQHLGRSADEGLIEVIAKNTTTGEDTSLNAPLVLGCDGFKSKVRDFANMKYTERDLNKTAVVGTVKMDLGQQDANEIAYQRFSAEKDTVAALLPLDREYSSFVISAPKEYSEYLKDCDDDIFIQEFNQLLSVNEIPTDSLLRGIHDLTNMANESLHSMLTNTIPNLKAKSENDFDQNGFEEPPRLHSVVENSRASFPLYFGTTTPRMVATLPDQKQSQIALLGDSSHRVHPLAGQGLNLGIQDAIELVKQLETVARSGERVFDDTDHYSLNKALRRYELNRQVYIVPMLTGILSMPNLFKFMPSTILSSIDRCKPIKSTSIKIANGC